ncbi:insulinase family protein [Erwinia tracheiphila]|uniref:insulinase family protein n=1 Tax=Erwinia tracheiphila TaxID=65700 RepID=UPI001F3ED9A0|nr:pitrilysin family protein [Erwinia tracheiphila]UIA92237.1 insulinase family protein [Erwinia tracheiphila]
MQGSRIRLLVGGVLLIASSGSVQAETLHPDPAWQQGKLNNNFSWQILSTPQRPSDRIEVRLMVNTGSLMENVQQSGYSHLLPRLALVHNAKLDTARQRSLWQQSIDPDRPQPPIVTSYDFTLYNLSLPNNRPELVKEALSWLAATVGEMNINQQTVNTALNMDDPIASWPANPQDVWWRYRLKGSALLDHDPLKLASAPVDSEKLNASYKQWYTPDAMTLFVVGNVDSRNLAEQISKAFSPLQGKRTTPTPIPTLSPLAVHPVSLVNGNLNQDRLSLVWDSAWHPIVDSQNLQRYWQGDLAREALFWHVQRVLSANKAQKVQVGFDCRVLYQRAQCAINLDADNATLASNLNLVAHEMANIRDNGLPQEEFDALMAQKTAELRKLFATYARTDTNVLMSQRLRSQQNAVVDIAPEQYQKLRQSFLSGLTLQMMNQELRQQLSQDITMVLMQPQGEAETDMQKLQQNWLKIMQPTAPAPVNMLDETRPEVSDIPAPQN